MNLIKYYNVVIFMILLAGCGNDTKNSGEQEKNSGWVNAVKQTREIPSDNVSLKTVENKAKEKRILTAEEQLKLYYAQKGIEYPQNESKVSHYSGINESSGGFSSGNTHLSSNYNDINDSAPDLAENNNQAESDTVSVLQRNGKRGQDESGHNDVSVSAQQPADIAQNISQDDIKNISQEPKSDEPEYSDSEPPILQLVSFDPPKVAPGTDVVVIISATDNLSGVDTIYGMIKSPSGSAMLSFNCPTLMEDGSFSGIIKVPKHAGEGIWQLQSVNISDKVHNTKNYSLRDSIVQNSYFEVLKSDADSDPPELIGVYLTPKEINAGNRVNILVDAKDDKSGVQGAYGVLISPSKNARLPFACQADTELNTFAGFIDVPADAQAGYWSLDYLRLDDIAKNSKLYYPKDKPAVFENAKLNVVSKNSDSQGPVLENLEVYPVSVIYEETVEFIIRASDDISGIDIITARIKSPANAFFNVYFSYVADKDYFTGKLFIPRNSTVGTWCVDGVTLIDKARNVTDCFGYNNNLVSQATFDVIGE